jgi:hypothetical protein
MLNLPTLPYVKAPGIHTRAPHVQQQVLVPSADGTVYHVTQHFTIPSELVAAVAQVVSASSNDLSSGSIEELSDEASDCCTLTEPTPPPRPFHHPSQPESTAHRLKASDSSGQDLHLAKRLFSDSGVEAGCAEDMASTSTEPGNHKKQRRTTNTQQESQILQYGTESGGMLTSIRRYIIHSPCPRSNISTDTTPAPILQRFMPPLVPKISQSSAVSLIVNSLKHMSARSRLSCN